METAKRSFRRQSRKPERVRTIDSLPRTPALPAISASSRPFYRYMPLPPSHSSIRVLSILPGPFISKISVTLSSMAFDTKSAERCSYEALSYTWGSEERQAEIYLYFEEQYQRLIVTRNCEEALRHLRFADAPRLLWIDAICINQEDMTERARQVMMMQDIFRRASQVIVWLGPTSMVERSDLAMAWINTVGQEITYDWQTQKFTALGSRTDRIESKSVLINADEFEAFQHLINRDYFERLWVWQEIRAGEGNVQLKCGDYEIQFRRFLDTVWYCCEKGSLEHLSQSMQLFARFSQRLSFLQSMTFSASLSTFEAIDRLRDCKCKDRRDRIYTSHAFSTGSSDLRVTPDYTRSVHAVYRDFIIHYIKKRHDLEFFLYIGNNLPREETPQIVGLPFWVPDWSRRNAALRLHGACCRSSASILSIEGDRLTVRGVSVDRVRKLGPSMITIDRIVKNEELHDELQSSLKAIVADCTVQDAESLAGVLSNGNTPERQVPPTTDFPSLALCESYLKFLLNAIKSSSLAECNEDYQRVLESFPRCLGRRLIHTTLGQFGLGPRYAVEGDLLVSLLGCPGLVVLRRQSRTDTAVPRYYVVGVATCTGAQNEESFLGSLGEQYETVRIWNAESQANFYGFRQISSGELSFDDPRLSSMPAEWANIEHRAGLPPFWKNLRTGETRDYLHDPRLDAEALESRGVKLEEFCLI